MPPRKNHDAQTGKYKLIGLPKGLTRLNQKRVPVYHKILELLLHIVALINQVHDEVHQLRKEITEVRMETKSTKELLQQILRNKSTK